MKSIPGTLSIINGTSSTLLTLCLLTLFLPGCFSTSSERENPQRIEIVSYVLRYSSITLDDVELRSKLIVGAKITGSLGIPKEYHLSGELYSNGKLLAKNEIRRIDSNGNSLSFDILSPLAGLDRNQPVTIPVGTCKIVIKLIDGQHQIIAETEKTLEQSRLGRTFEGMDDFSKPLHYLSLPETAESNAATPQQRVLRIFQFHPIERVFEKTDPAAATQPEEFAVEVSRDESRSLTFSIRAYADLGTVRVSTSSLKGIQGRVLHNAVRCGIVGSLTEEAGGRDRQTFYYRYGPRIIYLKNAVEGVKGKTQTFWLTLNIAAKTPPGMYEGAVTIDSDKEGIRRIPLRVRVLPLTLPHDTEIQYGMMMDYAFYELDNPGWSMSERRMLGQRGREIYQDLRDHGMTMAYPHSHFFYRTDERGEPVLDSLKESLHAYATDGFPGPFVWYLGHLLNTAKTKHPGSILLYDEKVAERRLGDLLYRFERLAAAEGIAKNRLLVQLLDEPDKKDRFRIKVGKRLNAVAKDMGFKTLITRPWPEVDVMCTGAPESDAEAAELRSMGNEWWIYPNEALSGRNLCYTRYVFGFGAWRWGVQGVVPWTYQMSQGSNGNPFTVLDGPEIMVTYPGKDGPFSTPIWESIREGINDYRYICLLEKLISAAKANGNPAADRIEKQLNSLKQHHGRQPGFRENDTGDWTADAFDKKKAQIASWAMELSQGVPAASKGL